MFLTVKVDKSWTIMKDEDMKDFKDGEVLLYLSSRDDKVSNLIHTKVKHDSKESMFLMKCLKEVFEDETDHRRNIEKNYKGVHVGLAKDYKLPCIYTELKEDKAIEATFWVKKGVPAALETMDTSDIEYLMYDIMID
jgi:hypothetical protein